MITGARQIGKTFSITRFLEKNFESVITINFADRNDLIEPFARLKSADDLLVKISLVDGMNLHEGKTVIFLDEIQLVYRRREEMKERESVLQYQDILTAMKKMCMEGKYRFVLSGSLLGVTLNNLVLDPLGYLDKVEMFPLDFEEYLWAKGVGQAAISYVKECFQTKTEVDNGIHKLLLDSFREYVLIGGLPAVVDEFMQSKNVQRVALIQKQVAADYVTDILNYVADGRRRLNVKDIYEAIPSELNAKNKRFISSHVLEREHLRKQQVGDDFLWLTTASIAIPVYNVTEPVSPLKASEERKTMKLFMNDIGLLSASLLPTGIREKLLCGEKEINFGAPYENAAAQELFAHGFEGKLYYYNSKKHGEVDFLLEYKGDVLPLEIKSGKTNEMNVYNHTALNNLLKIYGHKRAFVFGEGNVKKENDKVIQLPIYMIDFLRDE